MIFINPWASYNRDDIPDLNPHDDEEMVGCLAGACGFIVSTIIYVLLMRLGFTLTEGMLRLVLIMVNCVVIYPILIICLMKLSFKIGDKIYKKRKENKKLYKFKNVNK